MTIFQILLRLSGENWSGVPIYRPDILISQYYLHHQKEGWQGKKSNYIVKQLPQALKKGTDYVYCCVFYI